MKKKILIAAIYLSGCFCGYISMKSYIINCNIRDNKTVIWSKQNRNKVFVFVWTSWILALGGVILNGTMETNDNPPANW